MSVAAFLRPTCYVRHDIQVQLPLTLKRLPFDIWNPLAQTSAKQRKLCAMATKADDVASVNNPTEGDSMDKDALPAGGSTDDEGSHLRPPTYLYDTGTEQSTETLDREQNGRSRPQATEEQLGPLPLNWEKAYTETGEVYFIDHNTGTSHWLDPRLSKFQKRSLEECLDDELPYGWEKIDDTLYGTYFIDHVNRRTQYENPVLQAKRAQQSMERKSPNFTRNPEKLKGQRIRTTLIKSSRGLGFTIVGGDDSVEEFLQIKSVVPNGPAWLDGKLQTGDVLVYVNDTCVLGFSHNEMVNVFKSIGSGETVTLEVCRGYPLPFDPNDPNTEVVTTIAVNAPDTLPEEPGMYMDLEPPSSLQVNGRFNFLDSNFLPVHGLQNGENLATTSVNSMPDLCISDKINTIKRPSSTDILLSESGVGGSGGGDLSHDRKDSPLSSKTEFLSIAIVKGAMGFGFTIADSAHGQKVKKILDRQRCKNLMEGDILVNINDVNVRDMCHSEVVQVLKDCPRNEEALIHVQRSTRKSNEQKKEKNSQDFFRSKTPTADVYSGGQSKAAIPSRPKTPLVDTRGHPGSGRSPNSAPSDRLTTTWDEITTSESVLNPLDGRCYDKYSEYGAHGIYYTDPYKTNVANLAENFAAIASLDDAPSLRTVGKRDWNTTEKLNIVNDVYSIDVSPDNNISKQNGGGSGSGTGGGTGNGGTTIHSDYYKELYSATARTPPHAQYREQERYNVVYPIGQEQNVDTGEIWDKRKETTSFEHEQPHSSPSVSRYPQYSNDLVCPMVPDIEWIETLVTLVRQDTGFGFRIVGGTEEGSQVSVGHIVPGGAADLDNRLNTGDLIMSVDGESVMNCSHHHVVQLMIAAAQNGRVTLGIRRRINTGQAAVAAAAAAAAAAAHHHLQDNAPQNSYGRQINLQYPYDVTVVRTENEGFGFVIISSVNKAGSTIGRIIEGSPAERCGRLNVGDHILAVNHVDITNVCHKDIVNLIKDSGYSVTLTIGYPLDDCCSSASLSQKDEPTADGDGGQYHAVELTRGTRGFGFSIRGGREFQNMPLFVLQIADNGPASIDNRLRVGDQIIEINGINTKNMTHTEAIEIIRNGGPSVRLLVRRGCQLPSVSNVTFDQTCPRLIDEGTLTRRLFELRNESLPSIFRRKRPKLRFSISLTCCTSKSRFL